MTYLSEHTWDATQSWQFLATEPLSVFDQNIFPNTASGILTKEKTRQELSIDTLAKIVLQCGIMRHKS